MATARCAVASSPCAAWSGRATPVAPWWTATATSSRRSSRRRVAARAAATECPTTSWRGPCRPPRDPFRRASAPRDDIATIRPLGAGRRIQGATLTRSWRPRFLSSPRSPPWGRTSRACCPGRSRSTAAPGRRPRAGSRGPNTSSRGPSATSSNSPSPTSTTSGSRNGGWPTCRSCRATSSSSCATSVPRSR